LKNACSNNYHSIYFSSSNYYGKWLLLIRDIKKLLKILDILQELIVEKKVRDTMKDLKSVNMLLKEEGQWVYTDRGHVIASLPHKLAISYSSI